jgi:subtilisin family serine protease
MFVPGRLLVKLSPSAIVSVSAALSAVSPAPPEYMEELDVYVVSVDVGAEEEVAADLLASGLVEYAEPDYLLVATTEPNDPYYASFQWNLPHIGADDAWEITTGSSGITIAVLDTGVDLGHPELAGKVVPGYDFVNSDADPGDDHGHGTHVASIAAAMSNNALGVAGLSWGARIMPVKVLGADGVGAVSGVAAGIRWAADHHAHIINLSLGGGGATTLQSAVDYAHDLGALVVASAGNEYEEGNPTMYPAACEHVLAVAATDDADGHASYSNSGSYVDVAAPGGDPSGSGDADPRHWILGAYWRGGGYDYVWAAGTSQAAPQVSGLAALLLSINGSLTNTALEQMIRDTALDVGSAGWDEFSGDGRIDASAAVMTAHAKLPTSAGLAETAVQARPGGVLVTWRTSNEVGVAGFNVQRADASGQLEPITDQLIVAAQAGSDRGDSYGYWDAAAASGGTYRYVLEVVKLDGGVARHLLPTVAVGWWQCLPRLG